MRTFDLMTGYHAHDFMDGSVAAVPRFDERSNGRNIEPDAETFSTILRTALSSNNQANMRQALRIVDHVLSTTGGMSQIGRKRAKKQLFFARKLGECIIETVQGVLTAQQATHEVERWRYLADEARRSLALMPGKQEFSLADDDPLVPTLTVDRLEG